MTEISETPPPRGVSRPVVEQVVLYIKKQREKRRKNTDVVEPGTPFDRPHRNRRGEYVDRSGYVHPHPQSE